jgi:hypothetical protein
LITACSLTDANLLIMNLLQFHSSFDATAHAVSCTKKEGREGGERKGKPPVAAALAYDRLTGEQ